MRQGSQGRPRHGLRIAMWNIWGFSWEWERRRPLVAAELADLAPDVVFLHEARAARSPWEAGQSTPEQVAGDTGIPLIEWIDAPTAHPTARMGPALLSRVSPVRTSRLLLADRVRLLLSDGAAGVNLAGAVVVANLPYIPSAVLGTLQPEITRWEPAVALDGGADGLVVIRKVVEQLGSSGACAAAFEIGFGQADTVAELLRRAGFGRTDIHRDVAGEARVVAGTRVS